MSWLHRGQSAPHDGDTRELEQPQPLDGYYERAATHEYHDGDAWQPAVVERLGSDGRAFVVPAMRTWPEEGE